jgi:hypothetical protein
MKSKLILLEDIVELGLSKSDELNYNSNLKVYEYNSISESRSDNSVSKETKIYRYSYELLKPYVVSGKLQEEGDEIEVKEEIKQPLYPNQMVGLYMPAIPYVHRWYDDIIFSHNYIGTSIPINGLGYRLWF